MLTPPLPPFCAPGLVAFRQHLQNLARTKGILELNKVQLLYEQMGTQEDPSLPPASPHPYLLDPQLQVSPLPPTQLPPVSTPPPLHPIQRGQGRSAQTVAEHE